jgi:tRNA(fMet)-specific endonuclease VapC
MTGYILDSDHISLHQRQHLAIVQRLAEKPPTQVFVTIVTVEEQLRGWLAVIRRSSTPERLIAAYTSLHRTVIYFARVNILDYGEDASNYFAALRDQRLRIGTQDLRIASIALAVGAIVVTRNRRDFQQVPGLVLEDWSEIRSPC